MTITESHDGGATFTGTVDAQPFSFENSRNGDVKSVLVTKSWKEGISDAEWPSGISVLAILKANGTEIGRSTLNAASPSTTFSNLPVESGGQTVSYTVDEEIVGNVICRRESVPVASSGALDSWLLRNTLSSPVALPFAGGEGVVLPILGLVLVAGVAALRIHGRRRQGERAEPGE